MVSSSHSSALPMISEGAANNGIMLNRPPTSVGFLLPTGRQKGKHRPSQFSMQFSMGMVTRLLLLSIRLGHLLVARMSLLSLKSTCAAWHGRQIKTSMRFLPKLWKIKGNTLYKERRDRGLRFQ